jgi:ankyrin repeat protein
MQANSEIIQAIQTGNINGLMTAIQETPDLVNAQTPQGSSLLMTAIYSRQSAMVEFLLNQEPTLDFFELCALGKSQQAQEMLELNPSLLNAYAADGFYPSGLAIYFGHNELAKWLFEQGADVNQAAQNPLKVAPLHAAVSTNNAEMVEYLLQRGANVNQPQQQGVTPLHGATHNANLLIVKLLLKNGANPNLLMDNGKTPLDMAIETGHSEVIDYLEKL